MKIAAIVVSVLLLGSCSSPPNSASGSPAASATQSAPPPTESPSPTTPQCPNPDGGASNLCLGSIDAGTYQTEMFNPQLTYTVPAGWSNFEDLPGNFLLMPPGAPLSGVNPGTSDYLGVYTSVVAPGHCNSQPSTEVPLTFDGLVSFLTSNPGISASNVHHVSVGGSKGVVMDLAFKGKGDGCSDGVWADIYVGMSPSSLIHSVIPHITVRVYLLHNGADILAIELQDAVDGNYKDWFGAAAKVIETFKFH